MEWNPPTRKRMLSPEEAELWASTMREVRGLKRRGHKRAGPVTAKADDAAAIVAPVAPPEPKPVSEAMPVRRAASAAAKPGAPALAGFDERERRRLARNSDLIDARLDLHGMRQHEAHAALRSFLFSAYARGCRHVLVITGKGIPLDRERDFLREERGVLRRLVPQWLNEPELRSLVISYAASHTRHGGEGALYVKLRKRGPGA
jgi:DNA-nicking Smr family endonuclease